MIIAISGFTGCGKNTLGELLAKKMGYKLICPTFKDLAAEEGISLMEFQAKAAKDKNIDKKFDAALKKQVAAAGGNCVVTTWLGPWMVDADLRVKLFVADEIRAGRVAKRDGVSKAEALKHMQKRDKQNIVRYKKVYGINIADENIYDVCFNSGKYKPQELLDMVFTLILTKNEALRIM